MIFSASRRTDIPSFYADWLFARLAAGEVCVRYDGRNVTRYRFARKDVDCLVLWTKNPLPLLDRLPELRAWPCAFQVTLTAYGPDVEPGPPDKTLLIAAFKELAVTFPGRMVWRYDPVLLYGDRTVAWHLDRFERLAARLEGCADTCVISFMDWYPKVRRRMAALSARESTEAERHALVAGFAAAAARHGFTLSLCAEEGYGLAGRGCVSREWVERAAGYGLDLRPSRQRPLCRCVAGVDIGAYDTCGNGCLYCYANGEGAPVGRASPLHDPASPLLVGWLSSADKVTDRLCVSQRNRQLSFL